MEEIHARGHELRQRGKFIVCTRCRTRRSANNFASWANIECRGTRRAHNVLGSTPVVEGSVPIAQEGQADVQMVTRAKRKRVLQERAQERKRQRDSLREVKRHAIEKGARDCIAQHFGELEVVADCKLPFDVHESHKIFTCGGYATCIRCAATESCSRKSGRLPKECAGTSNIKSRWHVMRLLWPDGSEYPQPRRLRH